MSQYLKFRRWANGSSGAERIALGAVVSVFVGMTGLALVPNEGTDGRRPLADPPNSASVSDSGPPGAGEQVGPAAGTAQDGGAAAPAADGGVVPGAGSDGAPAVHGAAVDERVAPGAAGPVGAAPPRAGRGSAAGPRGGPAAGSTARSSTAVRPAARPAACAASREVGVTGSSVSVASILLNLGGAIGNSAVGLATPEQQKEMTEGVVREFNAKGGAACRKIVVRYFEANPLDPPSAQRACLAVAEAGVYAVVDGSGLSYPQGAVDCVPQRRIPIVSAVGPTPGQYKTFFPYYMSQGFDPTQSFRNMVLGMRRLGFFDPAQGFKKLGLFMDDCSPEVNKSLLADLARIGIPEARISISRFACPSTGFASPSEQQSAVVKHRQDGVSHVIPVTGGGSFKGYSSFAQQQGFKPRYTNSDYNGFAATATGGTGPDRDNYDGTVAITSTKIGMDKTGFSDGPTDACKALFRRQGLNPNWLFNGFQGGRYCNMYGVFVSGSAKAPAMTRAGLSKGVGALGRVDLAFPESEAVYTPADLVGGDFYWPIRFTKACTCWKVIDRVRRPSER